MAPDRQDATHRPHPLHKTGLISALPAKRPSSVKEGAEYGQIETHTPHELQSAGMVSATVPLTRIYILASRVTARVAAAWACAMASSTGLGPCASPHIKIPSVVQSTGRSFTWASMKKPSSFSVAL